MIINLFEWRHMCGNDEKQVRRSWIVILQERALRPLDWLKRAYNGSKTSELIEESQKLSARPLYLYWLKGIHNGSETSKLIEKGQKWLWDFFTDKKVPKISSEVSNLLTRLTITAFYIFFLNYAITTHQNGILILSIIPIIVQILKKKST